MSRPSDHHLLIYLTDMAQFLSVFVISLAERETSGSGNHQAKYHLQDAFQMEAIARLEAIASRLEADAFHRSLTTPSAGSGGVAQCCANCHGEGVRDSSARSQRRGSTQRSTRSARSARSPRGAG